MAKSSTLVAACGEHYVAAYLSGMGLVVGLLRGGVPRFDMVATREDAIRSVSIQVKTGSAPRWEHKREPSRSFWSWDTPAAAATQIDDAFWYTFVALNGWPKADACPIVFFVPSHVVAKCIESENRRGAKRPTFWMYDAEAEQSRGQTGFAALQRSMQGQEL